MHSNVGTGAVFQGTLNCDVPQSSSAKYSGYCAIQSKPMAVSYHQRFQELIFVYSLLFKEGWFTSGRLDVSGFDAFQLRVRGDGRRFIANLRSPSLARKDELWQQFVFTRGGPEWESIRVSYTQTMWKNAKCSCFCSFLLVISF